MSASLRRWRLALAFCLTFAAGDLRAETFLLASGGRIEGEIVNPEQSPRENYVIKTDSGGRITLARAQVKEVIRQTDAEAEFEKVRPQFADSPDGQFALAEWCREHGLERLRNKHLKRVLELDPSHKEAHRLLHHFQGKSQKKFWEDQGYVLYQGDWMSPQEVELKERARQAELAAKEWRRQLKVWRGWLNSDRSQEAIANINQIDDPYAVPALTDALTKETAVPLRNRYIEALARIGSAPAWQVLCQFSLRDDNEDVRQTCLDFLDDNPLPAAVNFYIKHLKDPENRVVLRAADGLLRMKDRRAIGPLIDALVTSHKRVISPAQAGGMSATFGLGGYSFGTPKAQVVTEYYKNENVLNALVQLTGGVNFGYEVDGWKTWRASQKKKTQSLNARRD
ncbi:MAG TPA: HEAT repeat domain-containing protein [Pirellulales bacterium]|nr:HEAT repeat domain-containing protein [Pirellulales bacterium]